MSEKVRLQFDFTEEQVKALDVIVTATGAASRAASRAEVIRRAINLMGMGVNRTMFVKHGDDIREVVFL